MKELKMNQQKFKLHRVSSISEIPAKGKYIPSEERYINGIIIQHIYFLGSTIDDGDVYMLSYDMDDNPPIHVIGKVGFSELTEEQKEELRGPRGFKGDKGEKGDKMTFDDLTPEEKESFKGERGEKGEKGDRGDKGMRGEPGLAGSKGEKGEKGEKGDPGQRGPKGDKGNRGQKGDRGMQGNSGVIFDEMDLLEIINNTQGGYTDPSDPSRYIYPTIHIIDPETGKEIDTGEPNPEYNKEYAQTQTILSGYQGYELTTEIKKVNNKVYLTEDEYDELVRDGKLVVGIEYNVYE